MSVDTATVSLSSIALATSSTCVVRDRSLLKVSKVAMGTTAATREAKIVSTTAAQKRASTNTRHATGVVLGEPPGLRREQSLTALRILSRFVLQKLVAAKVGIRKVKLDLLPDLARCHCGRAGVEVGRADGVAAGMEELSDGAGAETVP